MDVAAKTLAPWTVEEPVESLRQDECREYLEAPAIDNRAARGMILGIVLGGGIWAAILVAVGVIKL